MKLRHAFLPALVALAWSCSDSGVLNPPNGFDHSVAMPTCGPADEPYVAIYLAGDPFDGVPRAPYLHLNVPTSFTGLRDGQTWEIGEYPSGSNAWFLQSETSSYLMPASSGDIRITDVSSSEIEGWIDLRFPDGSRFRGGFDAEWQDRQTFCG